MKYKNIINKQYCNFVKQSKAKQSKAKPVLYLLNNNYFKFLFQKYFLNLVKSFLTSINFLTVFIRFAKNKFAILNNNVAFAYACRDAVPFGVASPLC